MGSKPYARIPSLEHQSPKGKQVTTSGKSGRVALCQRERWLEMQGLFKGPTHKFSFTDTYPGLRQRQGQRGLELLEEKLGTKAFGRELRE